MPSSMRFGSNISEGADRTTPCSQSRRKSGQARLRNDHIAECGVWKEGFEVKDELQSLEGVLTNKSLASCQAFPDSANDKAVLPAFACIA